MWYTIEEQIPFCERERGKDTRMIVDRRVSSIESSFKMESMPFDAECRQRVRNVLTKKVSATDAIKLGVKAPIRESGNVAGSAPIAVVGPKGAIYLNEGCIIAKRHIHMPPKDAMAAGVHDGDVVSVQAENERGTVFNHVQIRVDDSFTLEMHIDTDEANAAKIATGQTVRIIK